MSRKIGLCKYKIGSAFASKVALISICSVSLFSCTMFDNGGERTYLKDFKNIQVEKNDSQNKQNKYAATAQDTKENIGTTYVKIKDDPQEAADEMLAIPSKKVNVALIVPLEGEHASIGNMIVESALITAAGSRYGDVGNVNIYNIGKLPAKDWQSDPEVKRLINDGNDVIVGSVFTDTTEKLLSVLPKSVNFISFTNDASIVNKYPNLTIFSMNDSFRFSAMCEFMKAQRRRYLALILPATKKGFALEKLIRAIAQTQEIMVLSSQFYQEGDKPSITSAAKNGNQMFEATYMIDENGKFTTEDYKKNLKKKKEALEAARNKNPNADKRIDTLSLSEQITVNVMTDSIYIEGSEDDLSMILDGLNKYNLLNKDINLFTNAILDTSKPFSPKFERMYFVGYNYQFIGTFNKNFKQAYGHSPNFFAYMTYDTLSLLFYLSNEGNMLPRHLYLEDGFRGVLDEFRVAREGNIERRMNIYKIRNQTMAREFVPEQYYGIYKIKK